MDSGSQVLDSSLCQRNFVVSEIPDSLSCIPDSKAKDSGFDKRNFCGFWKPKAKISRISVLFGRDQVQKKTFLACSLFPIVGHAIILQRTVSFNSSYARAFVLNTVLGVQSTLS